MTDSLNGPDDTCRVCGNPAKSPWLLLNRYAVGSGKTSCMSEARCEDDEYRWYMEFDPDDDSPGFCTGVLLCWPVCAQQWIEGKMVEADYELRGKHD